MRGRWRLVFWAAIASIILRSSTQDWPSMIDPIAFVGVALAIVTPFLQWKYKEIPRWATDVGIAFGCFLFGVAFSPILSRYALIDEQSNAETSDSLTHPAAVKRSEFKHRNGAFKARMLSSLSQKIKCRRLEVLVTTFF